MGEKLIFVPSGTVIEAVKNGVDLKEAIEFYGHDAGVFIPPAELSPDDIVSVQ